MPDYIVVTAFKSKDQMSADLKKMGLSAKNFGKVASGSFRKTERSAISLKRVIGGIFGAAMLHRGVSTLTQGVRTVATEFMNFDDSITAASAKFGVMDKESKVFKDLAKTAREVGAATEFTAPQAAEGLRFLAKAGWKADAAMQALPSFVDLATASEMEFSRAADIATDVMGAFRLQSDDAAQNLTNLTRVNDVLTKSVNMSNIDMEDMFETIKMAGPIAATAGVSIEKFGAMAAFIGGAGIKGSLGGTALRTMFLALAAPTDKIKKKFRSLGISIHDSKGNLEDPIGILGQLSEKFSTLGTAQKAAALNLIFGKRAVSGAAVAMDGARSKLLEFNLALKQSKGTSEELAKFMRTSLGNRIEALKSAAIELGFKVLDAFAKKFPGGIDAAVAAIRQFDVKPIVEGIRSAIRVGSELISFLRENIGLIKALGIAFVGLKLAGWVNGIAGVVLQMVSLGTAVGGVNTGLGIMATKSALALTNISGVIAALGAGVAIGTAIYEGAIKPAGEKKERKLQGMTDASENARFRTAQIGSFSETTAAIKQQKAQAAQIDEMIRKEQYSTQEILGDLAAIATGGETAKQRHLRMAQSSRDTAAYLRSKMQSRAYDILTSGAAEDDEFAIQTPGLAFAGPPGSDSGLQANQKANAAANRVDFRADLNISGAPTGSTLKTNTKSKGGAPKVRANLLGANP